MHNNNFVFPPTEHHGPPGLSPLAQFAPPHDAMSRPGYNSTSISAPPPPPPFHPVQHPMYPALAQSSPHHLGSALSPSTPAQFTPWHAQVDRNAIDPMLLTQHVSSIAQRAAPIEQHAASVEQRAASVEQRVSSVEQRVASVEQRAAPIERESSPEEPPSVEQRAASIERESSPGEQRPPSAEPRSLSPSVEANNSSWAARNPTRPVLATRPIPHRLTEAQKASRSIAREQRKAREKKLDDDVKAFHEAQQVKVLELSRTHNVTVDKVKDLLGVHTHYKKTRKPALHNAILHVKATEVNQDLPVGEKMKLSDLKNLVSTDEELRNLTKEQKEAFVNQLAEHREHKMTSMRANNASAARDMLCTSDAIIRELDNLALRTGAYGCFFLTRGHINDTAEATWYGTDNSMDFWEDVLKLDPDEICRLFEQWACSRHQNITERDNLQNVRRQSTRALQSGLKNITNNKKVKMNYSNYETAIVELYSVMIVGWPEGVKFVNPSAIGTVGEIRKLRDALKSGACHWVKLTKAQLSAHMAEVEERRKQGETIGKQRKKRSDAGTSRKRRRVSGDQENEGSGKARKRHARSKGKVTSAAVIESSSSDEADD